MKINFLFACVLGLMLFPACKTLQPVAPTTTKDTYKEPEVAISQINLPVRLDLAKLNDFSNKNIPQELYYGKELPISDGLTATVRVVRNGKVAISANNGIIKTVIPIKISEGHVDYKMNTIVFGTKNASQSFAAALTITAVTKIGLDKNWNITSQTTTSFAWDSKPSLKIAGFDVSLGTFVDKPIKEQMKKYEPMIDEQIKKSYDVHKTIEDGWKQISKPFNVTNDPMPVWLVLKPKEFNFAPVTSTPSSIELNIGLKTGISTHLGEAPSTLDNGKLLPLNLNPSSENSFEINLPVVVKYSVIKDFLKLQFVNKKFAVTEKIDIIVNDIDFYGTKDQLVVMADIISPQKKTKGKVFMVGKPVYNAKDSTLKVENVNFDINTSNVLLKSANWLLHGTLLKTIEKKAVFPLGPQITKAKAELEKTINTYKISDNFKLKSKINGLDIKEVNVCDGYMVLSISTTGNIQGLLDL